MFHFLTSKFVEVVVCFSAFLLDNYSFLMGISNCITGGAAVEIHLLNNIVFNFNIHPELSRFLLIWYLSEVFIRISDALTFRQSGFASAGLGSVVAT